MREGFSKHWRMCWPCREQFITPCDTWCNMIQITRFCFMSLLLWLLQTDTASPLCNTEAKMPTIRKTMKTIDMRAQRVSITAYQSLL